MKAQLLILFTLACVATATAQSITPEVVSSGGGDTANGSGGLSWTIGEPVSESVSGTNAAVTQGFHQSHFEIISVEEHEELGFDISVFPNPATDFINIEMNFIGKLPAPQETQFTLVLTDNTGKIVMTETIKNTSAFKMAMQHYGQGQYLLQVTGADGALYKSALIIKLK
ncbi:MAG: T9SS type A sorting domain-containing protein [Flavobacteriales bacterium]|nr:T9SS type A sorting domain-containing protein [Flavobacteriales bacterium]